MTHRTIDSSGLDERKRPSDRPVDYLVVLRVALNAEQAAEFEECEELILRHPTKPALIRGKVKAVEVAK
ncbi:MAG: hypothetical protein E6Q97_33750 [Desulfurellales bacterium]|nr:MAG: hypothetical protein E6Q97_33750 [Desulfurellales bacterium]